VLQCIDGHITSPT